MNFDDYRICKFTTFRKMIRYIIISVLNIILGCFIMCALNNCTSTFTVERSDLNRFEKMKKEHLNDSIVCKKVLKHLEKHKFSKQDGHNLLYPTNLINEIVASVDYNSLADSILYQTKVYLLEKDIDDIRQETNNIINKYNGLMSFWIAIITIIGGIVPWTIFYRNEDKYEKKFNNMKEDVDERLKNEIDKFKKNHNNYLLEMDKNKIINCVYGITSSANPSINKCNIGRENLTKLFLSDLSENFASFIEHIKLILEEDSKVDISKETMLVLLQIQFVIIKSKTIYSEMYIHRYLFSLHKKINDVINIIRDNGMSSQKIIENLDEILILHRILIRKI